MFPLPTELACPSTDPGPVAVEIITAGTIRSKWQQVVNDGTKGAVTLPMLVGVLRHPDALLTVDSGLGQQNRSGAQPGFPLSLMGDLEVPPGATVVEQLGRAPDRVLMTHLHYDHVGGLLDMPGAEVWLSEAEWSAYGGGKLGFSRRRFVPNHTWRVVDFEGPSSSKIMGLPAEDVMGDGSIYLLSLPGHTPGAAAVLVRGNDGPTLFVGDTAWVDAHLGTAMRPWYVSAVIDAERHAHKESLAWARRVKAQCPNVRIVAGHEPRWTQPPQAPR